MSRGMWRILFAEKRFRFSFRGYELHWDCNYGASHKTGWTVAYDGSFAVSHLEPSLFRAMLKARRYWTITKPDKDLVK